MAFGSSDQRRNTSRFVGSLDNAIPIMQKQEKAYLINDVGETVRYRIRTFDPRRQLIAGFEVAEKDVHGLTLDDPTKRKSPLTWEVTDLNGNHPFLSEIAIGGLVKLTGNPPGEMPHFDIDRIGGRQPYFDVLFLRGILDVSNDMGPSIRGGQFAFGDVIGLGIVTHDEIVHPVWNIDPRRYPDSLISNQFA